MRSTACTAVLLATSAGALVVSPGNVAMRATTRRACEPVMQFDFLKPKDDSAAEDSDGDEKKKGVEKKIDLAGLAQLVTMGAGAPSLGEFTGMEDNKMMFELEANNFFDEKGDVKKGQYFEDGWVDESDSGAGLPNPLEGFFDMFRADKKK